MNLFQLMGATGVKMRSIQTVTQTGSNTSITIQPVNIEKTMLINTVQKEVDGPGGSREAAIKLVNSTTLSIAQVNELVLMVRTVYVVEFSGAIRVQMIEGPISEPHTDFSVAAGHFDAVDSSRSFLIPSMQATGNTTRGEILSDTAIRMYVDGTGGDAAIQLVEFL